MSVTMLTNFVKDSSLAQLFIVGSVKLLVQGRHAVKSLAKQKNFENKTNKSNYDFISELYRCRLDYHVTLHFL